MIETFQNPLPHDIQSWVYLMEWFCGKQHMKVTILGKRCRDQTPGCKRHDSRNGQPKILGGWMSMSPNFTPLFYHKYSFPYLFPNKLQVLHLKVGCLQKHFATTLATQHNTTQRTPPTPPTRTTRDLSSQLSGRKRATVCQSAYGWGPFSGLGWRFWYFPQEGWDTHPV